MTNYLYNGRGIVVETVFQFLKLVRAVVEHLAIQAEEHLASCQNFSAVSLN